jgi:hypothetical protein
MDNGKTSKAIRTAVKFASWLVIGGLWTGAALAQTEDSSKILAADENGRFTMSQVPDGVMRLDSRTGQVSLCRKRNENWTCETVADDRAAYEKEIGLLHDKIAKLVAELGRKPGAKETLKLPSDADVDRIMKFFENILRRFKSVIEHLQLDDAPNRS